MIEPRVTTDEGTMTFGPQCVVCENTFTFPKDEDALHKEITIELEHDAAVLLATRLDAPAKVLPRLADLLATRTDWND